MGKKRSQIQMSDAEIQDFLEKTRTLILTSIGPDGFPHSVPMWFALDKDCTVRITTFAKSQKVLNVRRNPKVTLLAEDGDQYSELRGVMIKAEAEVVMDVELAMDTMMEVAGSDPMVAVPDDPTAMREAMRKVAEKRAVLLCRPVSIVSFDHRKLSGGY